MTTTTASPFSARLSALNAEIAALAKILPDPASARPDQVRAYLLLTHAAFEAAIESLVTICARAAIAAWKSDRSRSRVACGLLVAQKPPDLFPHWAAPLAPGLSPFEPDPALTATAAAVDAALSAFESRVIGNNGVRKKDILAMVVHLGLTEADLDATWLADIDAFGSDRGSAAHRAAGDVRLKTASEEMRRVSAILTGVHALSTTLSQLC